MDRRPDQGDVFRMQLQRDCWTRVGAMLRDNPDLPESYWWEFMVETYATTQAIAVRRQADTHPDVGSLAKIIEELAADATRITREDWLASQMSDDMGDTDPSTGGSLPRRIGNRTSAEERTSILPSRSMT